MLCQAVASSSSGIACDDKAANYKAQEQVCCTGILCHAPHTHIKPPSKEQLAGMHALVIPCLQHVAATRVVPCRSSLLDVMQETVAKCNLDLYSLFSNLATL